MTSASEVRSLALCSTPSSRHTAVPDRSWVPLYAAVDVSHRCQNRNICGYGHGSRESSGRSAHFHQTCRPEHRHRNRQTDLPSPSLWNRTKPPDHIGLSHSGHPGEDSEDMCAPYRADWPVQDLRLGIPGQAAGG